MHANNTAVHHTVQARTNVHIRFPNRALNNVYPSILLQ